MDKELLFKVRLPEAEVEIPGVGAVRVRGLSRAEALQLQTTDKTEPGSFERKFLSTAIVDPQLTEDEVGRWQQSAVPGELDDVMDKAMELSGFKKDSAKASYKEFEDDPDAEFHVSTS